MLDMMDDKSMLTVRKLPYFIVLILISVIIFLPMFKNQFVWDDQEFIVNNQSIKTIFPLKHFFQLPEFVTAETIFPVTNCRPVLTITLAVDYLLWRDNLFGYHLTNILLHVLCVILVFFTVYSITKKNRLAFCSALLFSVHPAHAEAVIAFIGRSDLLASLFILASIFLYHQYRAFNQKYRNWFLVCSLTAAVLACFSKETGVALILIIAAYEITISTSRFNLKKTIFNIIPFIAIVILYLIYRSHILTGIRDDPVWWGGNIMNNLIMMLEVYARYVFLLIIPIRLNPLHMIDKGITFLRPGVITGLVLIIISILIVIWLWKKNRAVSFWAFWFFAGLLPVANIIPIPGIIMAERWLYLPSIGFIIPVTMIYLWLLKKQRWVFAVIGIIIILLFAVRTLIWNKTWANETNLARTMIRQSPEHHLGYNIMGKVYLADNDLANAENMLRISLHINPEYYVAHNNLAAVMIKRHDYQAAENEINFSLHLNPSYADAYNNLGIVMHQTNRLDQALSIFQKSIELNPLNADYHYNYGSALGQKGFLIRAIDEFRTAVRLEPEHIDAWFNLGVALGTIGSFAETEKIMKDILLKDASYYQAYFNLAASLEAQGKSQEAIAAYNKYLEYETNTDIRNVVFERLKQISP